MTALSHVMPASAFTRLVVDLFETAAPGANTFVLLGDEATLDRYVPRATTAEIVTVLTADDPVPHYSKAVADADIVVVHRMTLRSAPALHLARDTATRVWSGWGADYYGTDVNPLAWQLAPQSERWERQQSNILRRLDRVRTRWLGRGALQDTARRATAFSAPIPDDVPVFRRRFPGFDGDLVQLNYETVEDTFSVGFEGELGDDILLGNSATITNNHFDVLTKLASAPLNGRRVWAPLSYGNRELARAVIEHGRRVLGDAFEPLEDLLPYDEYKRLVARCGIVIMGHRRQQAVGSIGAALWNGARVYLDGLNPLSTFLTGRGAHVFPIDGIGPTSFGDEERITVERCALNRDVLQAFWGREKALSNIRELMELHRQRA